MARVFLSPPDVGASEVAAATEAIESGWVAPVGPALDAFETDLAALAGRAHAVGLASCTAALHLALRELGVGPGDDVLASTWTFIGSVAPVVHLGATPVFVDSEPAGWNISPGLVREAIEQRVRAAGRPPVAAVVVDLYGRCADYDELIGLFDEFGIILVEDAAEAVGATYRGRPAGGFGAVATFSFNGNKLVTTGGGGALLSDDRAFADRIRHLATQANQPGPQYHHIEVGFNERLSNVSAAIGRAQLATVADRIARRRAIRARYEKGLGDLPGIGWNPVDDELHGVNHWLTCITIDPETGVSPETLRVALEADDIESRPLWKPMHMQPVFADAPAVIDGTTERLYTSGLCLPSGGALMPAEQDRVIDILRRTWKGERRRSR